MCGYQEGLCPSLSGDGLGPGETVQATGREGWLCCRSPYQLLLQAPGFPGTGMRATGPFQSPLFNSVSVCVAPHSGLSPLWREHSPIWLVIKTRV